MLVAQSWWLFYNFFVEKICGLQNTNEPGIGPWFSIPSRNYCTQKRKGCAKSVSEKSGS